MKRKEFLKELRGADAETLKNRLRDIAEELMKLRCRHVSGQVTQTHRFGVLKKDLARVRSVLGQLKNSAQAS